jgi:hypothetical protein
MQSDWSASGIDLDCVREIRCELPFSRFMPALCLHHGIEILHVGLQLATLQNHCARHKWPNK